MAIRVALHHHTTYRYDRPVSLSPQVIRLRPAPHCRSTVESYSLKLYPHSHFLNWQQDPFSNYLARVVFPEPTTRFSIEVDLVADMTVINPFDFFLEPSAEKIPFVYEPWLAQELRPFLECEPVTPRFGEWMASVDRTPTPTVNFLVALNQRLQHEIRYLIRMEPGVQTPEETLTTGSGSCRDTGWLLVQALRNLGLAARFVSGYLIQLLPDEKPIEGPVGPPADFTDLHAWCEVYLPGAGWVGLDPTSGLFAGEGHLPVAATPHPLSAAPVTGLVDPCHVEFDHQMSVTRIHEDPRVTKPYSDEQWTRIHALGHAIDRDLEAGDVRLTMGGEPTFVSIDDRDGGEWNFEAMGPNKRNLAGALFQRMADRFAAAGPLLHFGQGKWYPGEQLPRWALTCYWRKDGIPLWHDSTLIADERTAYGFKSADAERFSAELARQVAVDPVFAKPAYEDPLAYLHKERQLPANVDPLDNKLEDPEERERLRRVFERGLGEPVGFVLPLQRVPSGPSRLWQSGMWMLRSAKVHPGKVFLVPGDSPAGFRLPLMSLPHEPAPIRQQIHAPDPFDEPQRALPATGPAPGAATQQVNEQSLSNAGGAVVRTALCIEPRNGRMHVFMPPVSTFEDYADLLGAVERTASALRIPVTIEGYAPPYDGRIEMLRVTPDPGVIEVNIHPSRTWDELVERTTVLYEEARQSRLSSEKFMIDGRHTGTGGGNHLVLGAARPTDSPFLRRPDLLKSLVGYWTNHPSLSYLFSGMFIGPTSQAPRVDETRADAVYELEIAFGQVPPPGSGPFPAWLVDRIFRNLLVDVTGNTHRAEFCIDKLYAPESATGRLGLLELRAFEMPPHARMSLAQQLLLRALVARCWREPYTAPLKHWGTELHDRFLLPHFVETDFAEIIDELRRAGYAFETAWFAPHHEFRFPVYGRVVRHGVELELRQAIEPWYVLGEEPGAGGTARYVDSSVERLQVKVRGLIGDRFTVSVNGRAVPLHPTGVDGEFVAGVRYRAWQPPACLHPTIGVHTPLVFDLYDTWNGRSLGGCTYHVAHPGGRNYATLPVNANEAEARRVARFFSTGHTPGPAPAPAESKNPRYPFTLDLRRG
ncbi:MAG: transglutaminase family protein [Bryobacterales bacterium]|nr:transglutaminase family protein [Bryobacterales bacterium]